MNPESLGKIGPEEIEKPVNLLEKDHDPRKTEYFVNLMLAVKQFWHEFKDQRTSRYVFEMLDAEGLLEKKAPEDSKTSSVSPERKHGAPEHILTVMAGSRALAELLAEKINLSEEDQRDLIVAAALHDLNKDVEFQAVNLTIDDESKGYGQAGYDLASKVSDQKLKIAGVPDRIVRLHGMCGHAACPEMEEILANRAEISDSDKALALTLHYIDDIVTNPNIIDPAITESSSGERLNALDRRCLQNEQNPKYAKYNKAWQDDPRNQTGESAFEMQRRVGHEVEKQLAEWLGVEDHLQLPQVIVGRIERDIIEFAKKKHPEQA